MIVDKDKISTSEKFLPWALLVIALVTTVLIYRPGLSGPFIFDDIVSIQNNAHLKMEQLGAEELKLAALSYNTGVFYRPVPMISFALNHYFSGDEIYYYKLVNLAIHLVSGVLIFLLTRMIVRQLFTDSSAATPLSRSGLIAAVVAAAWLVHPINLTSVLYVVQRMAALSALFVLIALAAYMKGRLAWRSQNHASSYAYFFVVLISAVLGILSKENALLLPFYFFLIEWIVLNRSNQAADRRRPLSLATLVWLVIPVVVGLSFYVSMQMWQGFDSRQFTLMERLLTESRVIFYYLGLILLPRPAEFGLFHDDFLLSTGLFSPVTTIVSISALIGLVWMAIFLRSRNPLLSFGLLFFFAAHLMESTAFPLEIIHEHRNYLASFGVLLGLLGAILSIDNKRISVSLRTTILFIFCIFFAAITHGRALSWQNMNRLSMTMVNHHPESARSNYQAAITYAALSMDPMIDGSNRAEFKQLAVDHFTRAAELEPWETGALTAILLIQGQENRARRNAFVSDLLAGNRQNTQRLVVDSRMMADLPRRLRDERLSERAIVNLFKMSQCEIKDQCVFDPGQIDGLFSFLMSNPYLSKKSNRAASIQDRMAIRALFFGRLDEAEELIREAISINPQMAMFKLNAASIMMSKGRNDAAMDFIHQVMSEPQPAEVKKLALDLTTTIESQKSSK